ncbi:MAG TPA: ABC transporter permease, partial [Gemmatimonadaceae bacterium]|nr:ABC transporter permease [Gemmatimonadaceae bacterium]
MRPTDVILMALQQLRANKFRAFFTLLGIMVSVAFLVAVLAIIQGMNAYVSEQVAGSLIGKDVFQVRRGPISLGLVDDEALLAIRKRPRITLRDAAVIEAALPDAAAISLQSGWPTPLADVEWRDREVGSATVFGVTAPFQRVQDYLFESGQPLTDIDVRERRRVVVIGNDIAKNLFDGVDPIGQVIRIRGQQFSVAGVVAPKGRVLGQSFDGFVLMPITAFEALYGRRLTTTVSVKMSDPAAIPAAMERAQEAMRLAHRLRPGEADDFSIETADALVDFWKKLTKTLFSIIPAVVAIGIVVGGVVIMNIMLMSVTERTREIGIRMAVGASRGDIRRQFLAESVAVSALGGVLGLTLGATVAWLVASFSPLPARITPWSIGVALAL